MLNIARVTFRGVIRDRTFHGIGVIAVLFLFIPVVASLSMRQVTELSMTLSLSLISFILLLLAIFLGGAALWKDIERRYTFSVLALPLARRDYLLGKFCGITLFLLLAVALFCVVTTLVVVYSSSIYPSARPILWQTLFLAIFFDTLKYILLVAIAFLFSTISTSFFLPVFGTIAIFLVGSASQEAFDFLQTKAGQELPALVQGAAKGLYYLLPNFTAFDLKLNAIYGLPLVNSGLLLTFGYFVVYLGIVLLLATTIFSRRELK